MAQTAGSTKDEYFQAICTTSTCTKISWSMPLFTRQASWPEASTWVLQLDCLRHRVGGWGSGNTSSPRPMIPLDAPAFVGRIVTRGAAVKGKNVIKTKDQIYMRQQNDSGRLNPVREEENKLLSEQMGVKVAAYQYGMCKTHHSSVELFVYALH